MIVGCYTLDLYCDQDVEGHRLRNDPDTYTGRTHAGCVRLARKDGWVFHRDGRASCPQCRSRYTMTELRRRPASPGETT